jgi:hypothetical protein
MNIIEEMDEHLAERLKHLEAQQLINELNKKKETRSEQEVMVLELIELIDDRLNKEALRLVDELNEKRIRNERKEAQQLINKLNSRRLALEEVRKNLKPVRECQRTLEGLRRGSEILIQPPQVRTITVVRRGGTKRFRVAFPYVVFVKSDWIIRPAVSNRPLKHANDPVYWGPLPNVYRDLSTCMDPPPQGMNYFDEWVASFWNTEFKFYSMGYFFGQDIIKYYFGSVECWEQLTNEDPNFILDVEWPRLGTVRDLCRFSKYKYREPDLTGATFAPQKPKNCFVRAICWLGRLIYNILNYEIPGTP